ncbi:hypothetical protein ACFQRL_13355 [Microbacterium fluvii]|uniref:Integrase n=1 Tax=Microbacterium fluvii TaxID=415215 RepID=A0ABW2HHE5_9MICO|nr:hypothetical protein [Microbacterium fluvii]MCU4673577.1 hypothetical protein [Microbacterium fluvii]
MSALRQLESGKWCASVLLDSGHSVRREFSTLEAAVEWSAATENTRNNERRLRSSADARRSIDVALATLRRHANHGRLGGADLEALEYITLIAQNHPDEDAAGIRAE